MAAPLFLRSQGALYGSLSRLGIVMYSYTHSDFQTINQRAQTFTSWPFETEALARSGFLAAEPIGAVKCFNCKLQIDGFTPEDDPLEMHLRFSPRCLYAQNVKGTAELELKPENTCPICCEEVMTFALLPCYHIACCAVCLPGLRKCPVCQKEICAVVKVYNSL
jgi:hypothetical protein